MLRLVLAFFILASLGSCSQEDKDVSFSVSPGKIFPLGGYTCYQLRNPPQEGLSEDVQGPYHVEFPSLQVQLNTKHAVEVQSISIQYQLANGQNQLCALGKSEIQALLKPDSSDDRNASLYKGGLLQPTLKNATTNEPTSPPYIASSYSGCAISCGEITVPDPRASLSMSADVLIQGTIHYRNDDGSLNGKQDAFAEAATVNMTYL